MFLALELELDQILNLHGSRDYLDVIDDYI